MATDDPDGKHAAEADEADSEIITCWCGAKGTYDELFSTLDMDDSCAGTGSLNCYCGGDLCVCHHHGSIECDGCDECRDWDDEHDWSEEDGD